MKLSKKRMLLVSFMLFSLFFGAGNLIFPPFLGQNAGTATPLAMLGFLVTAVVLPVLGVIVVAEFDGMDKLAGRVGKVFSFVFTILIYLSIGPGLGIPRAASVPFEMAIAPYLPEGTSLGYCMLAYSAVFFLVAGWLALAPKKLVDRVGKVLTPSLLILMLVLFVSFLFAGKQAITAPQPLYESGALAQGFLDGYQTMDTIAALNFGLVIAVTLRNQNVTEKKGVMHYTVLAGLAAGGILSAIYLMLSYMGMASSGVYPLEGNGAATLRHIVYQLFGKPGAILLAAIFTLACLTTCVGLITSISQYFSTLTKKLQYKHWVLIITGFSFLICNQGLNTILSISVPILNAIYPVSIVLILLGLCNKWLKNNPYIFPWTVAAVAVVSVLHALDTLHVPLGFVKQALSCLPFYQEGMGWVVVALAAVILTLLAGWIKQKTAPKKAA